MPLSGARIARRMFFAALSFVFVLLGYGLCKVHPFGEPREISLVALDRAIPLLPWTVWIYASIPFALVGAWLLVPDRARGRRLLLALALSAAVCWVVFALFPTTYPRELYPTPDGDTATLRKLAELRSSDDPSNCFPSMHVALAVCIALSTLDFGWRSSFARALPLAWAFAVSASTLTTKQHYAVDVVSGAVVGGLATWLVRWATRPGTLPFWQLGLRPIDVTGERDLAALSALRTRAAANRWELDDLPWSAPQRAPARSQATLPTDVVRFVSTIVYVEEIAGRNFELLAAAASSDELRALYEQFAAEERRHAQGLRRVLALHGAELERPGLGASLMLTRLRSLDPRSDADAILVALSIPVFETFLDAGTIPFLREHPALAGPAFDALIRRICRDEASHLALNWIVSRNAARVVRRQRWRSLWGLRLLGNPAVYLGALATPFLALDVYGIAYRLGFDLRALLPSFRRLWRLHRREPELARFPPWLVFRLFVVCGVVATHGVLVLDRFAAAMLRRVSFVVSRVTGEIAKRWVDVQAGPTEEGGIR